MGATQGRLVVVVTERADRPTWAPARTALEHGAALVAVALATGLGWLARDAMALVDVAMLHLVAVALVAARTRVTPAIVAALASVVSLDFFFVPPLFTLHVQDLRHGVTFAVLLGGGVTIALMTGRLRRQTEAAREARARAEAEETRSAILSAVSHDVRTPLAVITGAATTLLDDGDRLDAEQRTELLRSVTEEAARMERLVANVLEMTRLEAGERLVKEWVPVEEIVGSALTRLEGRLEGRAVTTRLPASPLRVAVDPVLFEHVLLNLLDNAAKHTPPATPIEIEARAEGEALALEVADRGPGIAEADRARVFEKFHRGAGEPRGSGLGLAICRGIVRAHGGTIEALAREGGGAVLRVVLPAFDRVPETSA